MANPIVIVNVSVTNAPTPNKLQKMGALISQGGTTLGIGQYSLLTQPDDLVALLAAPLAITSLSWASTYGGTVTATTTAVHGITSGEQFITEIAGAVPAGYNGTFLATATGTSTFTYALSPTPGSETTPGTYTPRNVGELQAMVDTFFGANFQQPVYVLECGAGEPATPIANLTTFIQSNGTSGQVFYSYLVPRNWDATTAYLALIAQYEAPNAKTYFWTTTTLQTYRAYTAAMKNVVAIIEAPPYGVWAANALTAASYSGGDVTATTTTAHGVIPGQYFTISGCTPAGYNGTFRALPGTTGSTLIYAVASDPGSLTVDGTLVVSRYASAGIPATEFTLASAFQVALNYDPSGSNKVRPFEYNFLVGVTLFPSLGNNALLTTLKAANINYAGYAGEGGLSNVMIVGGNMMDGMPLNYWYSADWMQINLDLNIANAIINGSNTGVNPLYYNQDGIDRLARVAYSTAQSGIQFGMVLGQVFQEGLTATEFTNNVNAGDYVGNCAINAEPFPSYNAAHPGDYKIGKYGGLAMVMTPLRGFDQIIFNLNVTTFA